MNKPYSQYMMLSVHFRSGKCHAQVKIINLTTLYYAGIIQEGMLSGYDQVYDKTDSKTKNKYIQDRFTEVLV